MWQLQEDAARLQSAYAGDKADDIQKREAEVSVGERAQDEFPGKCHSDHLLLNDCDRTTDPCVFMVQMFYSRIKVRFHRSKHLRICKGGIELNRTSSLYCLLVNKLLATLVGPFKAEICL